MSFIKDFIKLVKPDQSVFTFPQLSHMVDGYTGSKLRSALKYALKRGDVYRITKGIYSISKDYDHFQFANKYRSPSYISLYSILQKNGIVFQPYTAIYIVTNRSLQIKIDDQTYIYRKIRDNILLNPFGVEIQNGTQIATSERAICDKLYLDGDEYFDNLRNINWQKMSQLNSLVYGDNKVISKFISKNST